MPCFIIHGYDGTDADAPARRQTAREAHLQHITASLTWIKMAVATLDGAGQPNGSLLITEFPDRAALDAWLAQEPYMQQKVWQKVLVTAGRFPPIFAPQTAA